MSAIIKRQPYETIEDIKTRNRQAGQHYFDQEAMRFFSSRVSSDIYPLSHGEALFITSEQDRTGFGKLGHAWDGKRLYTICTALENGHVKTGTFGKYHSLREAKAAAKSLQASLCPNCGDSLGSRYHEVSCGLCTCGVCDDCMERSA